MACVWVDWSECTEFVSLQERRFVHTNWHMNWWMHGSAHNCMHAHKHVCRYVGTQMHTYYTIWTNVCVRTHTHTHKSCCCQCWEKNGCALRRLLSGPLSHSLSAHTETQPPTHTHTYTFWHTAVLFSVCDAGPCLTPTHNSFPLVFHFWALSFFTLRWYVCVWEGVGDFYSSLMTNCYLT